MTSYNPTKLEDVVGFLNKVNKAVYGVAPFTVKIPVRHDKYEYDVVVNGVPCDLCDTNEHADLIHRVGELDICEGCYDHYN